MRRSRELTFVEALWFSVEELVLCGLFAASVSAAIIVAAIFSEIGDLATALSILIGVSVGLTFWWLRINPGPLYLTFVTMGFTVAHIVAADRFVSEVTEFAPGKETVGVIVIGAVLAAWIPFRRPRV